VTVGIALMCYWMLTKDSTESMFVCTCYDVHMFMQVALHVHLIVVWNGRNGSGEVCGRHLQTKVVISINHQVSA
jgi:hypothetical protein